MVVWVLHVVHAKSSVYVTTELSEVLTGELDRSVETLPDMTICEVYLKQL